MILQLPLPNATLRPVRESDAADVALCCNDWQLAVDLGNSAFPHPYTLQHAQEFIAFAGKPEGALLHLCVTLHDRLVGMMGIVSEPQGDSAHAEVGYWIGAQARGQGLASAGLEAFSTYAFAAFPQLNRLEALTFDYNTASQRVLEKAGYTREAVLKGRARLRDGRIVDDVMFARLRPERAVLSPA